MQPGGGDAAGHTVIRRRCGRSCRLCRCLLCLELGRCLGGSLGRGLVDHRLLLGGLLLLLSRGGLLLLGSLLRRMLRHAARYHGGRTGDDRGRAPG